MILLIIVPPTIVLLTVHSLLSGGIGKVVFEDGVAELAEVIKLVQVLLKLPTGQRGFNKRGDMAKYKGIQACRPNR